MTTTFLAGFLALGTSAASFVEETGTGYARVAVTLQHVSANRTSNVASATFTASSTDWSNVTQFAVFSTSTGGSPMFWWNRGPSTAVANTKSFVVAAAGLNLLFADAVYRPGVTATFASGDVIGSDGSSNAITAGEGFTVRSQVLSTAAQGTRIGYITGANMNVTTDQAFTLTVPDSSKFAVRHIVVTNASTSLTTAAGGIYPATSKGGTALVAAGQVYTGLTTATKYLDLTLAAGVATNVASAPLYLSLTTGQGAPATADVVVYGDVLS